MSNPVSSIGVTDAQWAAASDAQKRAWMQQVTQQNSAPNMQAWNGSLNPFQDAPGQSSGATQVASSLPSWVPQGFSNTVLSKGFWIRFGTVAGGIALVWVGVLLMLAANKTVRTVAVDAAKTAAVA